MLPEDAKKRKGHVEKGKQSLVIEHFNSEDSNAKPIPYSKKALQTAALEWLIETNQVRAPRHARLFIYLSHSNTCGHRSRFEHSTTPRSRKCLTSHLEQTVPESNFPQLSNREHRFSRCSSNSFARCGTASTFFFCFLCLCFLCLW